MKRYTYTLDTPNRIYQCRDLNAAEYMFSCRKTASIHRHDRITGEDAIIRTKTAEMKPQTNNA